MTKANLSERVVELQQQIVSRVQAIELQKEEKKVMSKSYGEIIKTLEAERDLMLLELEEVKDQIKRGALVVAADEILEKNAVQGEASLSLID